jgi:hypothetical protein
MSNEIVYYYCDGGDKSIKLILYVFAYKPEYFELSDDASRLYSGGSGSNVERNTDYTDGEISRVSSVSQGECRDGTYI